MNRFMPHPVLVASLAALILAGTLPAQPTPERTNGPYANDIASLARNAKREAFLHDPSTIVKFGKTYWLFATGPGVSSWQSADLVRWERGPRLFTNAPVWSTNVTPRHRSHFWAPDVVYHDGRYLVYYSVSQFGVNTSAIGLASNPTLDPADPRYRWTDEGIVIQTRATNNFNAIDPQIIKTPEGELWMALGSFWSGIKLVPLDAKTGLRKAGAPIHSLAYEREIEAAAIQHHDGYYYLFVNWGKCCRGVNSTYEIRIGRSREIIGPYRDKDGVDMMKRGGTLLLGSDGAFIGPGHAGIFEENGGFWFSCHFYDGTQRGRSMLAVRPLRWGAEGWPILEPMAGSTNGPAAPSRAGVQTIDPPEKDFFSKRLDFHGIPIKAHAVVVDEALYAARDRLSMMFSNLLTRQSMVLSNLVARGAALHIIGRNQVTTDLPEWRHDKGKKLAEYNGLTRDERTRGMGGLLTSCGEENLLRLEKDRYRGRDICLHEFAHNVLNNGCPRGIKERFAEQRLRSLEKGLWMKSYAGSNADEFFAELTMWYFGTHGDLRMSGPKPENGRDGLKKYDPEAFVLMDDFYSGRIEIGQVPPRRRGPASPPFQSPGRPARPTNSLP
jgi:arabinan endo-1,5-alpha-L-arabinosidase